MTGKLAQLVLKGNHVLGLAHKGKRHDVRMLGDEGEVLAVLDRNPFEIEIRVREVDAFVVAQAAPGRLRTRDTHDDLLARNLLDHALDAAVVEADGIVDRHLVEYLDRPARDPRRRRDSVILVEHGRHARRAVSRQDQRITNVQQYRLFDTRQFAEAELEVFT